MLSKEEDKINGVRVEKLVFLKRLSL